jgi:hypothetical protein
LADLRALEGLEEERGLVEEEMMRKAAMTNELERTILLEEVSGRQKSKILGTVVKRGRQVHKVLPPSGQFE